MTQLIFSNKMKTYSRRREYSLASIGSSYPT